MSDHPIDKALNQLAESLLLIDPTDLQQLAAMCQTLSETAAWAGEANHPKVASAAEAARTIVEAIILNETNDVAASLNDVTETVSALQQIIEGGLSEQEVTFPQSVAAGFAQDATVETSESPGAGNPDAAVAVEAPPAPPTPQVDGDGDHSADGSDDPFNFEPTLITGDQDLVADFIQESREHLDNADALLLEVESDPTNSETLNGIFRAFHTIKGVSGFLAISPVQTLAHEAETLLDKARNGSLALQGATVDVVFEAVDHMKQLVEGVAEAMKEGSALTCDASLGQLIKRIQQAADGQTPSPPSPVDAGESDNTQAQPSAEHADATKTEPATSPDVAPTTTAGEQGGGQDAKAGPAPPKAAASPSRSAIVKESVKVDADRLDSLVDTIGEMVIAETMVSQAASDGDPDENKLQRLLGHLDKITRELQEMAMSLRMVPVRSTFQKMQRLARDTAKKLEKPIEFVMTGEDTELDKTVVDRIGDPLVHMVRNAVDHGIENEVDARRASGKPEVGRVELSAYHKGGSIIIEITDDGRGIDRDVILRKAVEKGLVRDGDAMTDNEVFNLVLEPGFSTASEITDVSGRGVGMDVVKRNIESLRGKIDIRSEPGRGSVFSIRLPLTLAIIEGMVVGVGTQRYIIPTLNIVRMIRPGEHQLSTVMARNETLSVDDELIPMIRLGQVFNIDESRQQMTQATVVIVENDDQKVAVVVDQLLGQQQTVIKSLGTMLKGMDGIAGGAIMPDGQVSLILDIGGLLNVAATSSE